MKHIRRWTFTVLATGVTIVSGFYINLDEIWTLTLWVTSMLLCAANTMNIVRHLDQKESADKWYDKFIEMRAEFVAYRSANPPKLSTRPTGNRRFLQIEPPDEKV